MLIVHSWRYSFLVWAATVFVVIYGIFLAKVLAQPIIFPILLVLVIFLIPILPLLYNIIRADRFAGKSNLRILSHYFTAGVSLWFLWLSEKMLVVDSIGSFLVFVWWGALVILTILLLLTAKILDNIKSPIFGKLRLDVDESFVATSQMYQFLGFLLAFISPIFWSLVFKVNYLSLLLPSVGESLFL